MLAASSVTSPEIALPLTVVLSTLLARPATSAVKLVISLATVLKRLPMAMWLLMLLTSALHQFPRLLQ